MVRRVYLRWGALIAVFLSVLGVRAAGDGEGALAQQMQIAEVAVTIDENAFVDWNRPGSAIYQIQNDIIRQVFRSAALDGAENSLTGDKPAVLSINITHFDILSDIEQLFCCARNEVMADYLLIDGNMIPKSLSCPATALVKGDALSLSVAAASIVAKVTRDRIMVDLAQQHPGYGWEKNAGYPTKTHREALESLGPTPHHRRSFKTVHKML